MLDHLDVARREHVGLRLAPPAEREHVRVLDEQQRVGHLVALARLDQRELAGPRVAVRRPAEIDDAPRGHALRLPRNGRRSTAAGAASTRALVMVGPPVGPRAATLSG